VSAADAVAAVDLDRLIDDFLRVLGSKQLGHGGLTGDARRAHVLRPGGAVDEQCRRIDVERHLGDARLDHLQVGQRGAE
jgi:hypothetical protein